MKNKYYLYRLRKLLEKNTCYESSTRWGELKPYIITSEQDYYKIMKFLNKIIEGMK